MYLHEFFLIRPDLCHKETIIQTANCLERLANVINEVFDRIDNRVKKNCDHIKSLNNRSSAVKNKIESLMGINKATTIFSPVRFPNVSIMNKNHSIENTQTEKHIKKSDIQCLDEISFEVIARRSMSEKSKFYYVDKFDRSYNYYEGFPYYTETINSLLLFNTYHIGSDRSKHKKKTSEETVLTGITQSEPSPLPVLNRNMNTRKIKEDLFYTPSVFNAPELDLPHYLPDLPGIADDIEFNVKTFIDMPVQKSVSIVNQTIGIPEMVHQTNEIPKRNIEINNKVKHENKIDLPVIFASAPEITKINKHIAYMDQDLQGIPQRLSPPTPTSPTPPPPPPLPMTPKTNEVNQQDDRSALLNSIRIGKSLRKVDRSKIKEKIIAEDSNPHSSLMASIRQAGGVEKAKLRAVNLGGNKQQKTISSGSCSDDLMADLHKKLALRRKGISGIKHDDSKIVSDTPHEFNLMESISSMIPVPLNFSEEINENDDDSDWD